MAHVIKSNSNNNTKFISVPGAYTPDKLKPNPVKRSENTKPILRQGVSKQPSNTFEFESYAAADTAEGGRILSPFETAETAEPTVLSSEEAERLRFQSECDKIKAEYAAESEKITEEAKQRAEQIIAEAELNAAELYAGAAAECEKLKAETAERAFADGRAAGFTEGSEKGYEDGYDKGLLKCKATLKELMRLLDETSKIKEQIYREHEHELFETIFTIANKVAVDSLKQKDKAVLKNMLREAAKRFRNSEFIRVSLSKLDTEEMGNAEVDALRNVFRENQHIEFEIIKDAPEGTLILDNGSEITDAGIATQLKMIENLGRGKFRDKPDSKSDNV